MNTLKRATILLAALLGFAATQQALADNAAPAKASQMVALSDAELDNITAGAVITLISNPASPHSDLRVAGNHGLCINCGDPLIPEGSGRFVNIVIFKPDGTIKNICATGACVPLPF
jgi:hypothetical protein